MYTVYSDCVLKFAFAFLSGKKKKKKKSALNKTFSTESYRNWRKSITILKNNGLFLKNKQKISRKRIMGSIFTDYSRPPPPSPSRPSTFFHFVHKDMVLTFCQKTVYLRNLTFWSSHASQMHSTECLALTAHWLYNGGTLPLKVPVLKVALHSFGAWYLIETLDG